MRLVCIDRDWASYTKGTRFEVVAEVPCGEIPQADGSTINPVNLRVVLEGDNATDPRAHRTIPAEYAVDLPQANDAWEVEANQGDRDGTVLATIGTQVLLEYEMPNGRVFGRILDVLKPGWYRPICVEDRRGNRKPLPAKWEQAINA